MASFFCFSPNFYKKRLAFEDGFWYFIVKFVWTWWNTP